MKGGRQLGAALAAVILGFTLGTGAALGETTGDLYVAAPAGVLEIDSAAGSVLSTVPVAPRLGPIAIRPDGRELFAVAGERDLLRLDLESMTITDRVALPAPAAALVHPQGEKLIAALPSLRRLAVLDTGTGVLASSDPIPGPVDLLAADRRDGRVVAASRGGRWIAVFDTGTGDVRSTTIHGSVAGVALDGKTGVAIVITSAPDRLLGLDLRNLTTVWSATVPADPSAVVATADEVVVAVGRTLWAANRGPSPVWSTAAVGSVPRLRRWGSLARPVSTITLSDDGTVLYAAEADRVEVFDARRSAAGGSSAGRSAVRTVRLSGSRAPTAIAAVPGARPLLGGPGSGAKGGAAGASPGPATSSGPPPPTDTVLAAVRWIDTRRIMPEALVTGLVILALGLFAIRWYERRGEP